MNEVYCVTCAPTGLRYVGQTRVGVAERWAEHLCNARRGRASHPLARAIREFGRDAFTVELLEIVPPDGDLDEAERRWIAELGTMTPHGYNATSGGNARKAYSAESRAKTSASLRGRSRPQEVVARVAEAHRASGYRPSDEQLRLLHARNTGSKRSPEQRRRISEAKRAQSLGSNDPAKTYQREWRRAKTDRMLAAEETSCS